jgi:hypothetical protein
VGIAASILVYRQPQTPFTSLILILSIPWTSNSIYPHPPVLQPAVTISGLYFQLPLFSVGVLSVYAYLLSAPTTTTTDHLLSGISDLLVFELPPC